jgi:hypothetical protein
MMGAAMIPSTVTAAPTMPVAMANAAAVRITTMKSEPRTGASTRRSAMKSRSISPACSATKPMKMKSGTAASSDSFMSPMVWKYARSKTTSPKPHQPKPKARKSKVNEIGKPRKMAATMMPSIARPIAVSTVTRMPFR